MSIEILATGDTVVPQSASTSDFAEEYYTDGTALDCLAQIMSASEARQYDARGERRFHTFFFATDPGITIGHRLKWTHQGGVAFTTAKLLRVVGTYNEGRPGEPPLLYIVDAELVTSRREV